MTAPMLLGIAMIVAYIPFMFDVFMKIYEENEKKNNPHGRKSRKSQRLLPFLVNIDFFLTFGRTLFHLKEFNFLQMNMLMLQLRL